jgi:hypothetical protein
MCRCVPTNRTMFFCLIAGMRGFEMDANSSWAACKCGALKCISKWWSEWWSEVYTMRCVVPRIYRASYSPALWGFVGSFCRMLVRFHSLASGYVHYSFDTASC